MSTTEETLSKLTPEELITFQTNAFNMLNDIKQIYVDDIKSLESHIKSLENDLHKSDSTDFEQLKTKLIDLKHQLKTHEKTHDTKTLEKMHDLSKYINDYSKEIKRRTRKFYPIRFMNKTGGKSKRRYPLGQKKKNRRTRRSHK